MSECEELKELIESWYGTIEFMDEAAIRDPPSKHQKQIRYLQNKIRWLFYQYNQTIRKDEGGEE